MKNFRIRVSAKAHVSIVFDLKAESKKDAAVNAEAWVKEHGRNHQWELECLDETSIADKDDYEVTEVE